MMRRVIGVLMLVMLAIVLARPRRWLEGRPERLKNRPGWVQMLIFFAIGIHGGFIQAGVGIFLLAGLVLSAGYELVRANAIKLLIVLCFTPIALAVFIYNGHVQWYAGLILGIGNMLGAWVASRMAVKRGAVFARWMLIAVLIIASAFLLGLRDMARQLL
jgi:hypothetical protein